MPSKRERKQNATPITDAPPVEEEAGVAPQSAASGPEDEQTEEQGPPEPEPEPTPIDPSGNKLHMIHRPERNV